jgi:hypothetical protein
VKKVRIFVCYSHQDRAWFDPGDHNLIPWLQDTLREEAEFWCDEGIPGGDCWEQRITDEISKAQIALLLLTTPFLTSPYIRNTEVPYIQERATKGQMEAVPILLEPCLWRKHEYIRGLQVRCADRPLVDLVGPNTRGEWAAARYRIYLDIRGLVDRVHARTPVPGDPAPPSEPASPPPDTAEEGGHAAPSTPVHAAPAASPPEARIPSEAGPEGSRPVTPARPSTTERRGPAEPATPPGGKPQPDRPVRARPGRPSAKPDPAKRPPPSTSSAKPATRPIRPARSQQPKAEPSTQRSWWERVRPWLSPGNWRLLPWSTWDVVAVCAFVAVVLLGASWFAATQLPAGSGGLEAWQWFEQGQAHQQVALSRQASGDYDGARECYSRAAESYERALALKPTSSDTMWNLILCLDRLGRQAEADRWRSKMQAAGHQYPSPTPILGTGVGAPQAQAPATAPEDAAPRAGD